jgi:hypothetical protein
MIRSDFSLQIDPIVLRVWLHGKRFHGLAQHGVEREIEPFFWLFGPTSKPIIAKPFNMSQSLMLPPHLGNTTVDLRHGSGGVQLQKQFVQAPGI